MAIRRLLIMLQTDECNFAKRPIGPHDGHATSMDLQVTCSVSVWISDGVKGNELVFLETLVERMDWTYGCETG